MPTCSYCGGTKFYEGPSDGMSTNIRCANDDCRHWFNHTPLLDQFEDLDRIEPRPTVENEPSMNLGLPRMVTPLREIYQEGAVLYEEGKSARDCLQEKNYGNYGAAASNLLRLTGYIDAMRETKEK